MEVIESATSTGWLGIKFYNGHYIVVDSSYEYVEAKDVYSYVIFEGNYEECKQFTDEWQANTAGTW